MKKFSTFILILMTALLTYHFWPESELNYPPGVLIPEEPIQEDITIGNSWMKEDYTITSLARFQIKARVLSKENYWLGNESDLSPTDLALGWGPMSDQAVIDRLDIWQGNRWFHWKAASLPIPANDITAHASNMHIIPANEEIENKLDEIIKGNIIEVKGYLVEVKSSDGWHWKSSLSRKDSGGGACEVVWVDSLAIIN